MQKSHPDTQKGFMSGEKKFFRSLSLSLASFCYVGRCFQWWTEGQWEETKRSVFLYVPSCGERRSTINIGEHFCRIPGPIVFFQDNKRTSKKLEEKIQWKSSWVYKTLQQNHTGRRNLVFTRIWTYMDKTYWKGKWHWNHIYWISS